MFALYENVNQAAIFMLRSNLIHTIQVNCLYAPGIKQYIPDPPDRVRWVDSVLNAVRVPGGAAQCLWG